jgi:acetyltransferase-like isoleucine patch superfamily enzyme
VIDSSARVHPTATVSADATVGPDVGIGAASVVEPGVYLEGGVVVGERVRIHRSALVYRGATIDDGVVIGPGAILTSERYPRAILIAEVPASTGESSGTSPDQVRVMAGSAVGAGAVVVAGCVIGSHALVGAGAVVTRDVPDHALVAGSPARRIGWVCACGERLHDSTGHPAPAAPERYAADPGLACSGCGRSYRYVPDEDSLVERGGALTQGKPA